MFVHLWHVHPTHSTCTDIAIKSEEIGNGRLAACQSFENVLSQEPADDRTNGRKFMYRSRRDGSGKV
jgi:hypothetical protein